MAELHTPEVSCGCHSPLFYEVGGVAGSGGHISDSTDKAKSRRFRNDAFIAMALSLPTPFSWAARLGYALVPVFLVLGLLLGASARAWMRIISTNPEFTMSGTLFIVLGFSFFAAMQSVAALAAQRPWRDWPRRGARCLGVVGLLPLFTAAGGMMAPAVVFAGLAVWHPSWPRAVRWVLALIASTNLVAVSLTITSDFGVSWRSLVGLCGVVLIYGCIVWAAAGTFSRPSSSPSKSTTA